MKALTAAMLLCLSSSPVWAADWSMEPDTSRLAFSASYQGEPVPGTFHRFQARLTLDPERPERGALNVGIDMSSLDLGSGELNDGAATAEWFDLAHFPRAEFQSGNIRRIDKLHYIASGTLSLKGVQRNIDLPFVFQPNGQTALMSGALEMQRAWFNIGTGDWASDELIGFKVQVEFEVTWRRED